MGDLFKVMFGIIILFVMYMVGVMDGGQEGFERGKRAGINATIAEVGRQLRQ